LLLAKISGLKHAIITGGTGGLGSAISAKLREEGWQVLALGSRDLDLSDKSAVEAFFAGRECDLLVCAAGMIRDQPLSRMELDEWEEVFFVNYSAAARCAEVAIPAMARREGGHVVFISSYAALRPAVGQAAYATAKSALLGLMVELADKYGAENVRVNAVLPGFLETPMTEVVSEKRREAVREMHYLQKFNTPAAAADFIWFLQEHMPFTSGQSFQLDSRP
jgi:3-oxoacyl-[acyl-carrier protein] reductase